MIWYKRLLYHFFGTDSFSLVYRYDITTGIVAEMYNSDGKYVAVVLTKLKPGCEYSLKSNQFCYDEFTNVLTHTIAIDPKIKLDLPRNIKLNVIDRRSSCLAY